MNHRALDELVPAGFSSKSPFARLRMRPRRGPPPFSFIVRMPDGTWFIATAGVVGKVWYEGEIPNIRDVNTPLSGSKDFKASFAT